jgi:hypothetical protein
MHTIDDDAMQRFIDSIDFGNAPTDGTTDGEDTAGTSSADA